jgi:hypothetical protein
VIFDGVAFTLLVFAARGPDLSMVPVVFALDVFIPDTVSIVEPLVRDDSLGRSAPFLSSFLFFKLALSSFPFFKLALSILSALFGKL